MLNFSLITTLQASEAIESYFCTYLYSKKNWLQSAIVLLSINHQLYIIWESVQNTEEFFSEAWETVCDASIDTDDEDDDMITLRYWDITLTHHLWLINHHNLEKLRSDDDIILPD